MQQGSSASALAARTAGMTDEQILDLDLGQFSAESAPQSSAAQDDMAILDATSLAAEAPQTFVSPERAVMPTAFPGSTNAATTPGKSDANAQGEPGTGPQAEPRG